ncbi:MAG: hypothetical protein NTX56_19990, partial [Proteobacteria bacterium]|nr:hypothetical protein [Pseudomonadota bacterium]
MNSRHLQMLGIPGFVGIGLLLFCASFYFSAIVPAQTQLDSAKGEARKLAAVLRAPEPGVRAAIVDTDTSLAGTKPASDPIEIIRRLNAAAETAAVAIDRSS